MILKHFWKFTTLICIIIIFIQRGCESTSSNIKIKVPEVIGKINTPTAIINHKGKKDSIVYKKGKIIYTENPFNHKMAEELIAAQKANDSLKVLNLYLSAIQEREQTRVFDDKYLTVSVYNKTRGELLDQKIDYKIKEREIEVPVPIKNTVFATYAGGGIYYNFEKAKPAIKLNLDIQNKKGDILGVGYDPFNTTIFLDYKVRILNIKK